MATRVVLCGDLQARYEAERLLTEAHPELHVESAGSTHDFVEKVADGKFDVAVLLKAPIAQHRERVHAVATLRSRGYAGPVLFAGSFLSEREEAAAAGADMVFDPEVRPVEELVAAALYVPRLGVDHPYLRFLFIGERVEVLPFSDLIPDGLDVLVVSTSCHADPAFFGQLPAYCQAHPETACVLLDDGGTEEARVEALSIGIGSHVVLETEGLKALSGLVLAELRASWLRRLRR